MKTLSQLFESNKRWASNMTKSEPDFFKNLSKQQNPKYLWIGCSDSRVPANQICGLAPGEMFVHRNVANLVIPTDFNCLAVVQYAIEVLNVSDIIICGHYGCGGVRGAMRGENLGLAGHWLGNIKDIYNVNFEEISALSTDLDAQVNRLCELNVAKQVENLCSTSIIQNAWQKGLNVNVHGWIYGLNDGLLKDLGATISSTKQLSEVFRIKAPR